VSSYDLLSELLLEHKSYNRSSSLPKLLPTITLINTSSITRIGQTKHIKDKIEVIIKAEVSKKALKAVIALETVAVSVKAKAIANITYYLHVRKSVIFVTS
jgi:hypothetical protein